MQVSAQIPPPPEGLSWHLTWDSFPRRLPYAAIFTVFTSFKSDLACFCNDVSNISPWSLGLSIMFSWYLQCLSYRRCSGNTWRNAWPAPLCPMCQQLFWALEDKAQVLFIFWLPGLSGTSYIWNTLFSLLCEWMLFDPNNKTKRSFLHVFIFICFSPAFC